MTPSSCFALNLTFDTIYDTSNKVFPKHVINLENVGWLDPWTIGLVCLKAIEFKDQPDKTLILPTDQNVLTYLKRMHFYRLFGGLTYKLFLQPLERLEIVERENDNVCEIIQCEFRDAFEAHLSSKIRRMFRHFGLGDLDEALATSLVGELGNNVFDHNDGSWPTSVRGAIILAQHNPAIQQIEVVVADPGIGFRGSLMAHDPTIANDVEAIKLGLSGVTGRIGEVRGNGLRVIQDWTINKFDGIVRIQSGAVSRKENVVVDRMRMAVITHYRHLERENPRLGARRMAEIAPGVIAVEDGIGECDAVFDASRWLIVTPTFKGDPPEDLKHAGFGVLYGADSAYTIEEMREFAEQHLAPVWYISPHFF